MDQNDKPILEYGVESSGPGYRISRGKSGLLFTVNQYIVPGYLGYAAIGAAVFCLIGITLYFNIAGGVVLAVVIYFLIPSRWKYSDDVSDEIHTIFDGDEKVGNYFNQNPIVLSVSDQYLSITPYEGIEGTGVRLPLDEIQDLWIDRDPLTPAGEIADYVAVVINFLLKENVLLMLKLKCNQSADLSGLELKLRNAMGVGFNPSPGSTTPLPKSVHRVRLVNKPGQIHIPHSRAAHWNIGYKNRFKTLDQQPANPPQPQWPIQSRPAPIESRTPTILENSPSAKPAKRGQCPVKPVYPAASVVQSAPPILNYGPESSEKGFKSEYRDGGMVFTIFLYGIPENTRSGLIMLIILGIAALAYALRIPDFLLESLIFILIGVFVILQSTTMFGKVATVFRKDNAETQTIEMIVTHEALKLTLHNGIITASMMIPADKIEDLWIEREKSGVIRQSIDFSNWRLGILLRDGRLLGMTIWCNESADLYGLEMQIRDALHFPIDAPSPISRKLPKHVRRYEIVEAPGKLRLQPSGLGKWMPWKRPEL